MPAYDPLTPRQQEFVNKLDALLREYEDVCGPVNQDDVEDGQTLTAHEMAEGTPVPHPALNEWIVLTSWVGMDDGDMYTTAFVLPGMPTYHRLGMLVTWMEAWK